MLLANKMIMENDYGKRFLEFLPVVAVLGLLYGLNQLALYNMNYIYILAGSIVIFLWLGCLIVRAMDKGLAGVKEHFIQTIGFAIIIAIFVGMVYIIGYVTTNASSKHSHESYESEDMDDEPVPYDWKL